MYCIHCGMQIPQEGKFCIYCGTPADKNQSFSQAEKKRLSKKSKLIITICGIAAALAATAVLVYFSLLANFSIQKKFIYDAAALFENAFGDLSSDLLAKTLEEPFELNMGVNIKTDTEREPESIFVAVSYDEEVLATNIGRQYNRDFVLLLIEDTLYISQGGYDYGIKYDTQADLSGKMSLSDRLNALTGRDKNQLGGAVSNKYQEAIISSIPSTCFSKDSSSITLTLTKADIEEALASFAAKVDADSNLSAYIGKSKKGSTNDLDYLNSSLSSMDADALIVMTLSYTDNIPTELNIQYSDNNISSIELAFAYEQKDSQTRTVTFDFFTTVNSDMPVHVGIQADIVKIDDGIEYEGSIAIFGMEMIEFTGKEKWLGASFSGSLNLTAKAFGIFEDINISYHGIIKIGMPDTPVINQYRYYIDTDNADIINSSLIPAEPFLADI